MDFIIKGFNKNFMKLLFLSQGEKIYDHPGIHDAFLRLINEGIITDYLNIPYFGFAKEYGWEGFYNEVVRLCKERDFDIVYFQYFHKKGKPSPKKCIGKLKKLYKPPIIITSSGDAYSDNWMRLNYPIDFKDASRMADITFSTQMGKAADKMIRWGAKNIVLSPNGLCQVRFDIKNIDLNIHKFDYDVVFIGSNNGQKLFNPISKYWLGAKKRQKLVKTLYKKFGNYFGLFGKGWDLSCSQGPIPFYKQQETYRRGKIVVGGNPYSYSDYYSSNRIFIEISSSVPTVELLVPRLDKILRNNDHCYFADDIDEVIAICERLLNNDPEQLYRKAAKAAYYIGENHSDYHRMKFQLETVKNYLQNGKKLIVKYPFFLSEVDLSEEYKFAIRNKN